MAKMAVHLPVVYSPRSLTSQPPPPPLPCGLFEWLAPLLAIDETSVLETAGLDVTIYLRFLRVAFQIFVSASLFGCAVLIPIIRIAPDLSFPDTQTNMTAGNSSNAQAVPWLDNLSITHVRCGSPLFYGHLALAYLITLLAFYLLHINYREYGRLRQCFILGSHCPIEHPHDHNEEWRKAVQPHHSWVMVNDIPEQYRSEAALGTFFAHMYPQTFACCIFARDTREIAKKVAKRQQVLERLERCCARARARARDAASAAETPLSRVLTWGFPRTVLKWSARKSARLRLSLEEQLDELNTEIAASVARTGLRPCEHPVTHVHSHSTTSLGGADARRGWSSDEDEADSHQIQQPPDRPQSPAVQANMPAALRGAAAEGMQREVKEHVPRVDDASFSAAGGGGVDSPVLGSAFVAFRGMQSAIHAQLVQHHTVLVLGGAYLIGTRYPSLGAYLIAWP